MEAIVDARGNSVKDSNGHPLVKAPSSRVELPYTYLIAWYVMHYPSLMTTVSASEGDCKKNSENYRVALGNGSCHEEECDGRVLV